MTDLGFSGTRNGMTDSQSQRLAEWMPAFTWLHHGDCIGADQQADTLAHVMALNVCLHPPVDPSRRAWCGGYNAIMNERPFLTRNREIVQHSAILIACPDTEERIKSGTWATVRYARKIGRPIRIIYPDGDVAYENT